MDQDMSTLQARPLVEPDTSSPLGQLVGRCVEASRASGRLRLLLRENEALVEELALPSLHGRIAEAATSLVPVRAAALAVLSPEGSIGQLVQCDAGEGPVSLLVPGPARTRLTHLLRPLPPGQVHHVRGPGPVLPPPWDQDFVAVAVHYRRDVLGVLLLAPVEALTAEDEDVLRSLAITAGTAIENARLYDEARRRQEWLQEAAEVGNGMLALSDERDALSLVAQSVQKLADAELVTAWTPGPADDLLVSTVTVGDEGGDLPGCRIDREDAVAGEVLSSGRGAVLCASEQPDCAWLTAVHGAGIGSVMVLPLVGDGRSHGLLLAGRRQARQGYSAGDLDMAETFAGQMALALDRISARAMQERVSLLEDRERIARDLHDHVIQSLFATGLKVQQAGRQSNDAGMRPRLAEAVQEIDVTIRRLRTTIFRLADPAAAGSGLRTAVLDVLEEVAPVLGFEPQVEFDGPVDATSDSALVEEVVAVLREAATNCGKHARATGLAVRLQLAPGRLSLTVLDDGVGLGRGTRRSGLANLHQRALRLGGSLTIGIPPGGGTRLCWSVPLPGRG